MVYSVICFIVPTVSFTISAWRVSSRGSGFSLNYNGVYLLIGFWEFAGVGRLYQEFHISHGQSHWICSEKWSCQKTWITVWWFWTMILHLHCDWSERFERSLEDSLGEGRNLTPSQLWNQTCDGCNGGRQVNLTWDPALFRPQGCYGNASGLCLHQQTTGSPCRPQPSSSTSAFGTTGWHGLQRVIVHFCVLYQGAQIRSECSFLICQTRQSPFWEMPFSAWRRGLVKCSRSPRERWRGESEWATREQLEP